MNEMLLSSKFVMCSKSIKSEDEFSKAEMNNDWNVNFL